MWALSKMFSPSAPTDYNDDDDIHPLISDLHELGFHRASSTSCQVRLLTYIYIFTLFYTTILQPTLVMSGTQSYTSSTDAQPAKLTRLNILKFRFESLQRSLFEHELCASQLLEEAALLAANGRWPNVDVNTLFITNPATDFVICSRCCSYIREDANNASDRVIARSTGTRRVMERESRTARTWTAMFVSFLFFERLKLMIRKTLTTQVAAGSSAVFEGPGPCCTTVLLLHVLSSLYPLAVLSHHLEARFICTVWF